MQGIYLSEMNVKGSCCVLKKFLEMHLWKRSFQAVIYKFTCEVINSTDEFHEIFGM